MDNKQNQTPLYQAIRDFKDNRNVSFHVPGHKNGEIFVSKAKEHFQSFLQMDLTELDGVDDLHAPEGIIKKAQELAADWFQSNYTYFLVNGSTVGNLAMILASCNSGDQVLVQRNCHKSILHGMELAGVQPIFLPPAYDKLNQRYTAPSVATVKGAIAKYQEAKAVILTYPDYFGDIYPIQEIIDLAHSCNITVLVDEAHGCHFSLPYLSAPSAVELGADIVVQSAHKMTPALTMAAYLHVQSSRVERERISYYLQMLQSSSPSYPIMASLDLARYYLATFTPEQSDILFAYIEKIRACFNNSDDWILEQSDDPLKICLRVKEGVNSQDIKQLFAEEKLYPELMTDKHILFILGLEPTIDPDILKDKIRRITDRLIFSFKHAKIEDKNHYFNEDITPLALSYADMQHQQQKWCSWEDASGKIAAEAIIPYPPGIPLLAKGEEIRETTVEKIQDLFEQKMSFQPNNRRNGLYIYDLTEGE
ncbi:aminotransferase class I/II-fold pyridoxal phosphate-dependent enzyme [Gracilibacillus suaedae]|uniref:aminotransferase class I/II-fold pyridoxal phosphate-dependent enzyme n=1 Tax=Gracilibacillus suaedae TaxID=2820273 RepID=UPI001ABDC7F3|nr:aminotransferase class I/II-fold pyridoxal phosphate-dependent enzyme [Gracilibacillus suaedae]